MRPRGLIAISLLTAMSAGIALFAHGHITTLAELLALAMLSFFWVLLPVLFLAFIAWDYLRSLVPRGDVQQASDEGRMAPVPPLMT